MTQFCRNFCGECDKCKAAIEECKRDDAAFAAIDREAKKNGQTQFSLYHRTTLERAALDHKGRP